MFLVVFFVVILLGGVFLLLFFMMLFTLLPSKIIFFISFTDRDICYNNSDEMNELFLTCDKRTEKTSPSPTTVVELKSIFRDP